MSIKKFSKKLLASLLIATAFVPLGLKINETFQNHTFANQNSNIVKHENIDFICISNNIHVEKNLYDQNPNTYNSNAISQVFESAKSLVKEKVNLDFNISIPIYIVDDNSTKFLEERENAIFKENKQFIYIKNKYFFENGSHTLAHEMIHASLCNKLGEKYSKLPLWIDEGIATQANFKNIYERKFTIKDLDKFLLTDKYPENNDENRKFYIMHEDLFALAIAELGIDFINNLCSLIINGMSYTDAFYKAGGGNAINKLREMAIK